MFAFVPLLLPLVSATAVHLQSLVALGAIACASCVDPEQAMSNAASMAGMAGAMAAAAGGAAGGAENIGINRSPVKLFTPGGIRYLNFRIERNSRPPQEAAWSIKFGQALQRWVESIVGSDPVATTGGAGKA